MAVIHEPVSGQNKHNGCVIVNSVGSDKFAEIDGSEIDVDSTRLDLRLDARFDDPQYYTA